MENSYEDYHIGKYGRLRLNYIKEYKKGLYTELMIKGTLSKHLADIEQSATERVNAIIKKLVESENINESLKENNQLEWIQAMNNIKNRAEEIVEKILKNVPKQNQKFVQKQLDQLDKNFMDYLYYWNEKYYRNGFVDGSQLVMGCFEE